MVRRPKESDNDISGCVGKRPVERVQRVSPDGHQSDFRTLHVHDSSGF